jgi:hypothetical protein
MKLMVCEGADDVAVVEGLCAAAGIEGLKVEHCGGRNNLERYLGELPVRPEFTRREVESVAVMIDAEASAEAAWQKLRNAVMLGFNVELQEPGNFVGTVPRFAGFVAADEHGRGMIEDLCLASVSDQPGYPCLQDYFRCLSERTERTDFHPKAKFRAWMASQSEFEYHVGKAASHGFIPWESAAFAHLRDFLSRI